MRRRAGVAIALAIGASAGCGGADRGDEPADPYRGASLEVVVLGDPAMAEVIGDRKGEWELSHDATVSVTPSGPPDDASGLGDVVVFPGDRLGELVDLGGLRVLDDELVEPPPGSSAEADELAFAEVVEAYRERVSRYGDERVALPLGGSAPVLVFRREAFEDEPTRAAAEEAGVALGPPGTWEELDALARFLDGRDWDGDGEPEAGIALALGPDEPGGLGTATFLARAAAGGLHRDYFSLVFDTTSMAPRITAPPFVEALEGLAGLADAGPEGMASFDAERARAAFRSGEAALLVDLAERSSSWLVEGSEAPVGVARLPGSGRTYDPSREEWNPVEELNRPGYLPGGGGWLVAVSAASGEPGAAADLARDLAGRRVAERLREDPRIRVLPVRSPLIGRGPSAETTAPGVSARDWSDAVSRTFLADRVVVGLRIPGASGYLADLDAARAAAASGEAGVAEALQEAADAWEARTDRLGRDRQRWHYRRSLNGFVTDPEPPPRG